MPVPTGYTQTYKAERYIRQNLPLGHSKLKHLANRAGVNPAAFRTAMRNLEANGVITVFMNRAGKNTTYRLVRGNFV